LLYESYPDIRMVCIEQNEDTFKRQQFHVPCGSRRLRLEKTVFSSFLAQYQANDEKSIFWLDYSTLRFSNFDDFMVLLGKVGANSIVKMTLRSNPLDYQNEKQITEFKKKFEAILPNPSAGIPSRFEGFAVLVQDMAQIASEVALPAAMPLTFLPVCSFYYSDSVGIFSLTGVVCNRTDVLAISRRFDDWQFANLDWGPPKEISVPNLSPKERLHLQRYLPRGGNAGRRLRRALGYLIDENVAQTEVQLQQYADFHRYFPYFIKATP